MRSEWNLNFLWLRKSFCIYENDEEQFSNEYSLLTFSRNIQIYNNWFDYSANGIIAQQVVDTLIYLQ